MIAEVKHEALSFKAAEDERRRLKKEKKEKKRAKKERKEKEKNCSSELQVSGYAIQHGTFHELATSPKPDPPTPQLPPMNSMMHHAVSPLVAFEHSNGENRVAIGGEVPLSVTKPKVEMAQVPVTSGATRKKRNIKACAVIVFLGAFFTAAFVFLQVGVRTASTLTVSRDGVLRAYVDPFKVNKVRNSGDPVKVNLYEANEASLLDVAKTSVDNLHRVTALRFAVLENHDWVVYSEHVASAKRSSDGLVTTVSFLDGSKLIINSGIAPPRQVLFERDGIFHQVLVSEGVTDHVASGRKSSSCPVCPSNSRNVNGNCECDAGFFLGEEEFVCLKDESHPAHSPTFMPTFTGSDELVTLAPTTMPRNTTGDGNYTNHTMSRILQTNFINENQIDGCIGSVEFEGQTILGPDLLNNFPNDFPGPIIRCASQWTWLEDDIVTVFNGCASINDYNAKRSLNTVRGNIGNNDAYWCAAEGYPNYDKSGNGNDDVNRYWGLCVPCPSQAPTTAAPSEAPSASPTTSPSSSPTLNPTKEPTASPTSLPSISPSLAPTEEGQTPAPTSVAPTLSPTRMPTMSQSPSVFPSKSPSKLPTVTPTRVPTSSPVAPATCLSVACQKQEMSHDAAKDFCEHVMGMKLCDVEGVETKISDFVALMSSNDEQLQQAASEGDMACFQGERDVTLWTGARTSFCAADEVLTISLSDSIGTCSKIQSREKHSVVCCDAPPSEEEAEKRMQKAQGQISTSISAAGSVGQEEEGDQAPRSLRRS